MDELLEQFLIEAPEQIEQASADLLTLERTPRDKSALEGAFRAVHTLKGSVALFDFRPMGEVLHAAESLLDAIRKHKQPASKRTIGTLLSCLSTCDRWLQVIARSQMLPPDAAADAARLSRALGQVAGEPRSEPVEDWLTGLLQSNTELLREHGDQTLVAVRYEPPENCFFEGKDPVADVKAMPELIAVHVGVRQDAPGISDDPYKCALVFECISTASLDDVRRAFASHDGLRAVEIDPKRLNAEAETAAGSETATQRTLRVDSSRVELIADLIGELVVTKNELAHLVGEVARHDVQLARSLAANQASINRLTADMHRAVLGLRRVPLSRTLRRLPRLVRDLGERLGKTVEFTLIGEDLEADKAVVDGLYDPLLHVLRNSIDHGLEAADERIAAGKPAEGHVTVSAARVNDDIVISVLDDGRGIRTAAIRERAIESGLRTAAEIESMADEDVLDLIFAPGFSTSRVVSSVSGRGVGMDAVRTTIAALGGRTEIETNLGRGTNVRVIVPQAVLITTLLVVTVGRERYGVPIDTIAETARIASSRIVKIRAGKAFVHRGSTVPILHLGTVLGIEGSAPDDTQDHVNVVLVKSGMGLVAVVVDGVAERIDALVRPMTRLLAGVPGALGTSILGDGSVLMVIDLPELIHGD